MNATYWCVGLEQRILKAAKVDVVGQFEPTAFRFGGHVTGLRPADHRMDDDD